MPPTKWKPDYYHSLKFFPTACFYKVMWLDVWSSQKLRFWVERTLKHTSKIAFPQSPFKQKTYMLRELLLAFTVFAAGRLLQNLIADPTTTWCQLSPPPIQSQKFKWCQKLLLLTAFPLFNTHQSPVQIGGYTVQFISKNAHLLHSLVISMTEKA